MRAAVARQLAQRCVHGGARLARRVTAGDSRLAGAPSPTTEDWRALISERWRILPIMRPVDIAGFFVSRSDADGRGSLLAHAA